MTKNPFKRLTSGELILWLISLITVIVSNIFAKDASVSTILGTAIGVTALIFVAKGDVFGQILTVVFSFLYAVTSFAFRYYGEMITYMGMTMPMAALSVISWLKHPFKKGKNEVKIHKLTRFEKILMILLSFIVTLIFYFILKALNTPNLLFSTISVTTSFLASYLTFFRNSYYALAYAANDIVLIVLWILATIESFSYFPMIICFVMFFINDIYGFISWKIREKKQALI